MNGAVRWVVKNRYPLFWSVWVTAGVVADINAVRQGKFEDTLTHNSRRITFQHPTRPQAQRHAGRVLVGLATLWTFNHIALGPHNNGRMHRFVVDRVLCRTGSVSDG